LRWILNEGSAPIAVGVHVLRADGSVIQFDGGNRVPGKTTIRSGGSANLDVALSGLNLSKLAGNSGSVMLEVELVQDGVAWFSLNPGNATCRMTVSMDPSVTKSQ
jgi:hypothetical protein